MKVILLCAAIIGLVCAAFVWRLDALNSRLAATDLALNAMTLERNEWKIKAEGASGRAWALEENARQCLAREEKAQADAAERLAIMERSRPRQRTEEERTRVVDDETRKRVIARLNAGL